MWPEDGAARAVSARPARAGSESLSAAAWAASPMPSLVVRLRDQAIVLANDACARLLGVPAAALTGGVAVRLWHDPAAHRAFFDHLAAVATLRDCEEQWRGEAGQRLDVLIHAAVFDDGDDRCAALHLVDRSRETRRAHALDAAAGRLEALFLGTEDSMIMSRLSDGLYLEVNDAFCRLVGFAREELIGRTALEVGTYATPEKRGAMLRAIETENTRSFRQQLRHRSGRIIDVSSTFHTIEVDGERVLVSIGREVTKELARERAVVEAKERLDAIFQGSPDGMVVVRVSDGVFMEVNDVYCRMLGRSRHELLGRTSMALQIWERPADRQTWLEAVMRAPRGQCFPVRLRARGGRLLECEANGALAKVDGLPCVIASVRDVSEQRARERRAAEANARFATAFRANPDAMMLVDLESRRILEVNDAYCRLTGFGRELAVGRTSLELGTWGDASARERWWNALRRDGIVHGFETELHRRDGKIRLIELSSAIGGTEDAQVLISAVRDVTEERARARREQASAERLAAVFETTLHALNITRLDDGRILEVNESFAALTGFTREEIIGCTSLELGIQTDPDHRRPVLEALARDGTVRDLPWRIRRRDGEVRDCLLTGQVLRVEDPPLLVCAIRDETELLRTARALEASERMLKSVLDTIPVWVYWKDVHSRYLGANALFAATTGLPCADNVAGRRDEDFHWGARAEEFRGVDRRVIESGRPLVPYEDYIDLDGERIWHLKVKVPMHDGAGTVTGVLGVGTDITALKRVQAELELHRATLESKVAARTGQLGRANRELTETLEQLQRTQNELVESAKLAALGALVAGVSHELNTPIGNALMAATTLQSHMERLLGRVRQGLTRSAMDEFLDLGSEGALMVVGNLMRASELIQGFKQVAVDRTSAQRRRYDLRSVVADTVMTLMPQMRRRGIGVTQDVPGDLAMDGFPGPLGQVLGNLLENAAIHGLAGHRRGEISITARVGDADRVLIVIADRGRGIAPEHMPRLFEPFFTTRLGQGGSGLGLMISRNIVTAVLGGRIEVRSAPGEGTAITLDLPRVAPGN
jgi:PAS domain S-box-containing protein